MIAGLAITLFGLALGAPLEHAAQEADHAPAAIEQAADTSHAAGAQDSEGAHEAGTGADDQHAGEGEHAEEWGTETMMHHIVDSENLELGPFTVSLEAFKIPPIRIGRVEIDLSPTKHVFFLMLASLLTILTIGLAARRARRTDAGREAPRGILNFFEAEPARTHPVRSLGDRQHLGDRCPGHHLAHRGRGGRIQGAGSQGVHGDDLLRAEGNP
jgi:hypothetical protein